MSKLYPPIIGGVIPAFYLEDGKWKFKIPYQQNPLVNYNEVTGFSMIIKSASTGQEIGVFKSSTHSKNSISFEIRKRDDSKVKVGMYYKIQIAYCQGEDVVGYYSSLSTIKCTAHPTVTVECEKSQYSEYSCCGKYMNSDKTERVLYYQFDVYENSELFESSGKLLHNNLNDSINSGESNDFYNIKKSLSKNKRYKVYYTVTTINNLVVSSAEETITIQTNQIQPLETFKPTAIFNREEGYIKVGIESTDLSNTNISGNFILRRQSSEDNYSTSHVVYTFTTVGESLTRWSWQDHSIKNGCSYKYSMQQYNGNNVYSKELFSSLINVNFDYIFLYDGARQLKVKFNPKVSSFKTTILETKTDTLGSKYPTFFRNDVVGYKEFPIQGLISYRMDDEKLFFDWESGTRNTIVEIDSSDCEVLQEQQFKIEVLDWLNNGQPKLFRSPTEGNYIIKLMNVSLSPEDTLGRMIHSFSATAYEIAEYSYDNLLKFGFIPKEDVFFGNKILVKESNIQGSDNLIQASYALSLDITINSEYISSSSMIKFTANINGTSTDFYIGATGRYQIPLSKGMRIDFLKWCPDGDDSDVIGKVSYICYESVVNDFNYIEDSIESDWQFGIAVGACGNILDKIEDAYEFKNNEGKTLNTRGLVEQFNRFGSLRFFKRDVEDTIIEKKIKDDEEYYCLHGEDSPEYLSDDVSPKYSTSIYELTNVKSLYRIVENDEHIGYLDMYQANVYRTNKTADGKLLWTDCNDSRFYIQQDDNNIYLWSEGETILSNGWKPRVFSVSEDNCSIKINDSQYININETEYYDAPIDIEYASIEIGPAVIAEYIYKTNEKQYSQSLNDDTEDKLPTVNGASILRHSQIRYKQLLSQYRESSGDENNDWKLEEEDGIEPNINGDGNFQKESLALGSTINFNLQREKIVSLLANLNSAKKAYGIALACAIYEKSLSR